MTISMLPRCPSCTCYDRPIPGNGPKPCRILLLGEAPAKDELRRGFPFAGRSGAELDMHYLPLAGLKRSEVYVSNARKCAAPGFPNPTPQQAMDCARVHLAEELRRVRPAVVVAMGGIANFVFETLFTPRSLGRMVDLQTDHGIPTRASFCGWHGWLIPTYHPAAGMRDPRIIQALREDFLSLRETIPLLLADPDGKVTPRHTDMDPHREPSYRELETMQDLSAALDSWEPHSPVAIDTETDCGHPWSLQFSMVPGTGYLIDARRRELVSTFRDWLADLRPEAVFHHALHDLSVMRDMDPPVTPPRWSDTMMMAYHAQMFSHGLKPLAYRLLGMEMLDYADLVRPHSIRAVEDYARELVSLLRDSCMLPHTFRTGKRKGQIEFRWPKDALPELRDVFIRFSALLRDCEKVPRPSDFDPWKRIESWPSERIELAASLLGRPFPSQSISHVPRQEAVYYACRDADATLRLLPILRCAAARVGEEVLA